MLTRVEINQFHPLGHPPLFPHLSHTSSNQNPSGGDEHNLIILSDELRTNQFAVALASLNCIRALRATTMTSVFSHWRAFTKAMLCGGEHCTVLIAGT